MESVGAQARGLLVFSLLSVAGSAASKAASGDGPVFALIDALKPVAEAVVVDGLDADWNGLPSVADPAGDAGGDPTRDIVSVSVAPLPDSWLVRVRTAGPPSTADLAFWLLVEYRGFEPIDLELGLYLGFEDVLFWYPEGAAPGNSLWDQSTTAIGSVVEVRVPLAALGAELTNQGRTEMADDLTGSGARSWVRITPYTYDVSVGSVVDTGPAVASYRLLQTPYALDPPLPALADPGVVTFAKPLPGLQYLGQGADGLFSHQGYWGYDFFRTEGSLFPDDPHPGAANSEYLSFGNPIVAPAAATVFSQEDGHPDLPPRPASCDTTCPNCPNFVFLDLGSGAGVLFSHTMESSISTTASEAVIAGQPIAAVGHSGSCSWPHLHLEAQSIGGSFPSRSIRFTNVEVGLNPQLGDPWVRRFASADLFEGLFYRTFSCSASADLVLDASDTGGAEHYLSCAEIHAGSGFAVRSFEAVEMTASAVRFENEFSVESGASFRVTIDPAVACD